MLTLSKSLVAAADKRPGDMQATLEHAAELAQHTEEGNAYWMGFGPVNVGLWRMAGALGGRRSRTGGGDRRGPAPGGRSEPAAPGRVLA